MATDVSRCSVKPVHQISPSPTGVSSMSPSTVVVFGKNPAERIYLIWSTDSIGKWEGARILQALLSKSTHSLNEFIERPGTERPSRASLMLDGNMIQTGSGQSWKLAVVFTVCSARASLLGSRLCVPISALPPQARPAAHHGTLKPFPSRCSFSSSSNLHEVNLEGCVARVLQLFRVRSVSIPTEAYGETRACCRCDKGVFRIRTKLWVWYFRSIFYIFKRKEWQSQAKFQERRTAYQSETFTGKLFCSLL